MVQTTGKSSNWLKATLCAGVVIALVLLVAGTLSAQASPLGQAKGQEQSKQVGDPQAAQPDDISYPLQEGFENGSITTSAFQSYVPTCVPGGCGWNVAANYYHTGIRSAWAPDVAAVSDQRLTLNSPISIPANAYAATLSFWHVYGFEFSGSSYYDGGVLEVSTNNGSTWSDSGLQFISGGYNVTLTAGQNPLAGRSAWGGQQGTWAQVQVNLLPFAGQSVLIRFREGTDVSNASFGWWVDDVQMTISSSATCSPPAWSTGPSYPVSVYGPASAVFNGKLYLFGGYDTTQTVLSSAYSWNPASGGWTSIASLPAPRYLAAAVSSESYIYILGGSDASLNPTNTLWRYDPAANSYTTLASYTYATNRHAAVLLNGKIYRIGGLYQNNPTSTVEAYTINTNTWAPTTNYPIAVSATNAVAMGAYLYTMGGASGGTWTSKSYRYDPTTATWNDAAIADLTPDRSSGSGGVLNGRWVLAGGGGSGTQVSAWNPATNTWGTLPDMQGGRYSAGYGVIGQSLYVVAGNSGSSYESSNLRYREVPCDPFTPTPAPPTATSTTGPSPTVCPIQFSDVDQNNTFYANIRCLACRGIINGYGDGTFRPGNNVTRGQLAKIVSNSANFSDPQSTQLFEDVPVGSTFHLYIGRLASRGFMSGYPCGGPGEPCGAGNLPYFRPNANATRGQISKIVSNAAGFGDPQSTQIFEDVPIGSAFHLYISRLATRGIMSGYPCGGPGEPCGGGNLPYFRPGNNATRGQTSKIVGNTFFPNCQTPNQPESSKK